VTRGILEQECSELLKLFFTELRERNKLEKLRKKASTEMSAANSGTD
jgi:tRNA(adenine34) deaminase